MNNEDYINKAIEPLLEMYQKIENDLLIKIAEHFKINEEFLNSDYWRIQKLEEMGLFNEEVMEYLAQYTGKTRDEIKKALEDIGYKVLDLQKLETIFKNGELKIDPNVLIQNNTIQTIINDAYNEMTGRFVDLSNKIEQATRNAYLDVVENAYLKTSMGTHSYQEAIRDSINDLGNKGIRTLTYTTIDENNNVTGIRTYDIEATVRREILTGARQLSNDINQSVVEELECEYIYLSEHVRCRPTHFDWQGTIIKYEDLEQITHYGAIDGLGGINCAHYFEAYFGDARGDELKSISKEDATKQYNLFQQQRYLERGVRKWKRKVEMFKANGDNSAYNKSKNKAKEWQKRLSNFTKDNNLRRDYTREYVARSNINNLNPYLDVTSDWLSNKAEIGVVQMAKSVEINGEKYYTNSKNKINIKNNEEHVANILINQFGGDVKFLPEIGEKDHVRSGDYFFKNEIWDLKEIGKNATSQTRAIDNILKDTKGQSNNFILDITNSLLDRENILEQVKKIYSTKNRGWIDKIIILDNDIMIKVFQRNKK